tara:strand:+ start:74395 stop:74583 length:189 start_codon:yes stop_codon:yes gene_type:complete
LLHAEEDKVLKTINFVQSLSDDKDYLFDSEILVIDLYDNLDFIRDKHPKVPMMLCFGSGVKY